MTTVDAATGSDGRLTEPRTGPRHRRAGPPGSDSGVWNFVATELAPLSVVVLLATIELRHVAHTSWSAFFLYTGDALTLPLFRESLAQHQVWSPVVSTQLLIFPEGVLYGLCSVLTTSIRASLVANAYLNILLLYGGARLLAGVVVRPVARRGAAAAVFTGGLVGLMLLEVQTTGVNLQFASLNLLTTYYYGLVIAGVLLVAVTARQLRPTEQVIGNRAWAAAAVGISTLTYFSDPLFLLWVTVPVVITVIILAALRRAEVGPVAVVIGCQLVSVLIGTALRRPFAPAIGSQAGSYVRFDEIGQALSTFRSMVVAMWGYPSERAELILVVVVLALAVAQFVRLVRQPRRSMASTEGASLVVATFAIVAPVIDVAGVLVSGNSTSRYFIPVFVFPLLALVPLVGRVGAPNRGHLRHPWKGAVIGGTAIVVTVAILSSLQPLLDPADFTAGQCFARIAAIRGHTGVGDFWDSRPLEAYSSDGTHVDQVLPNLAPFAWLVNRGTFVDQNVTFVVVDHDVGPPFGLAPSDTTVLGRPVAVYSCPGFSVYTYPRGTEGYTVLNRTLRGWAEAWHL